MDPGHSLPSSLRGNSIPAVTHFLPLYEDVNLPYSYRLPTYRSSYMRRYHPYPRYIVSATGESFLDDEPHAHDEAPLDFDISETPAVLEAATPAPNVEHVEDHLDVHEDPTEKRRVPVVPVQVHSNDFDGNQAEQVNLHDTTKQHLF